MKKFLKIFAVVFALVLCFGIMSAMAEDDIGVYVNGEAIEFDVAPQIVDSRTMIPFRYVANAFGAEVEFIEKNGVQAVVATLPHKELILTIGNTDATVFEDNASKTLEFDVAPFIAEGGRTLVPVRLVAEAFDCHVGWDGDARDVVIIDPAKISSAFANASPELFNDVFNLDLSKIKGTYDIALEINSNGEGMTIPADLKATDDALELSASIEGVDFEFIATDDILYAREKSTTGDKWVAAPLTDELADFNISDLDVEITADIIIDALCKTYVEQYKPTKNTYSQITSVLDILVDSAKDDGLVIKEDKAGKSVEYSAIFPLEASVMGIRIKKLTKNNVSDEFTLIISAADLEDTDNTVNFTVSVKRDTSVKTTKITIPKDSDIIKQ